MEGEGCRPEHSAVALGPCGIREAAIVRGSENTHTSTDTEKQGEAWDRQECLSHLSRLEGAQEVEEILLLLGTQLFEITDDGVGFGAGAGVFADGVEEIRSAAIV
jgi:hypothetical protein